MKDWRDMEHLEFASACGMDALRIALGQRPTSGVPIKIIMQWLDHNIAAMAEEDKQSLPA